MEVKVEDPQAQAQLSKVVEESKVRKGTITADPKERSTPTARFVSGLKTPFLDVSQTGRVVRGDDRATSLGASISALPGGAAGLVTLGFEKGARGAIAGGESLTSLSLTKEQKEFVKSDEARLALKQGQIARELALREEGSFSKLWGSRSIPDAGKNLWGFTKAELKSIVPSTKQNEALKAIYKSLEKDLGREPTTEEFGAIIKARAGRGGGEAFFTGTTLGAVEIAGAFKLGKAFSKIGAVEVTGGVSTRKLASDIGVKRTVLEVGTVGTFEGAALTAISAASFDEKLSTSSLLKGAGFGFATAGAASGLILKTQLTRKALGKVTSGGFNVIDPTELVQDSLANIASGGARRLRRRSTPDPSIAISQKKITFGVDDALPENIPRSRTKLNVKTSSDSITSPRSKVKTWIKEDTFLDSVRASTSSLTQTRVASRIPTYTKTKTETKLEVPTFIKTQTATKLQVPTFTKTTTKTKVPVTTKVKVGVYTPQNFGFVPPMGGFFRPKGYKVPSYSLPRGSKYAASVKGSVLKIKTPKLKKKVLTGLEVRGI